VVDQDPAGGRIEQQIDLALHHLSVGKAILDRNLGLRKIEPALERVAVVLRVLEAGHTGVL
jgi:hypothetical protein